MPEEMAAAPPLKIIPPLKILYRIDSHGSAQSDWYDHHGP
jgi:hypothetical protein